MWSHQLFLIFFASNIFRIVAYSQVNITLNEDPLIEVIYQVLTPETHDELPEVAIAAGGVLDVTFTYEGEGYVAFGITTVPGKMIYSENIIALYPTAPEKYSADQYDTSAVTRMANQTLIDASVTQENGVTVMKFKKLLKEPGEIELILDSPNDFIWAVGTGNVLAWHRKRSFFTADLEPAEEPITLGSTVPPYKAYWKAHGIMAVLAWGIFAPLAIASSLLRAFIPGPGVWFKIHLYLNMLCVVFTVISFFIAFAAIGKAGIDQKIRHHKIGITIFWICLLQVASALLRPHPSAHDKKDNDQTDLVNANDVEKDDSSEVDIDATEEKPETAKDEVHGKSVARIAFEIGHRLAGAALVVLAFYNIDDGLKLYALRYGNDEDYTTAFIIWIAALLISVAFGTVYAKFLYSKDE